MLQVNPIVSANFNETQAKLNLNPSLSMMAIEEDDTAEKYMIISINQLLKENNGSDDSIDFKLSLQNFLDLFKEALLEKESM